MSCFRVNCALRGVRSGRGPVGRKVVEHFECIQLCNGVSVYRATRVRVPAGPMLAVGYGVDCAIGALSGDGHYAIQDWLTSPVSEQARLARHELTDDHDSNFENISPHKTPIANAAGVGIRRIC